MQNAKAQLKRYRAAVLKSAVEGELTREWRTSHQDEIEPADKLLARILSARREKWEAEGGKGKYKEPAAPNIEGLPELPDGWVWVTVGQIADHRLGKMLDKAKNKGKLTPYLRNINVRWFEFDLSDIQHMRVTDDELENVSVVEGDLVVCEGGEPGRAAVWEKPGEPFAIQKALHRVRAAEGVLPKYLAYRLAADAWSGVYVVETFET